MTDIESAHQAILWMLIINLGTALGGLTPSCSRTGSSGATTNGGDTMTTRNTQTLSSSRRARGGLPSAPPGASQATFSKKSLVDLVTGGLIGMLYPLYPLFPLAGNMLQQAGVVTLVGYVGASTVQNMILNRVPGAAANSASRQAVTAAAIVLFAWTLASAPTVLFFPSMTACDTELERLQAAGRTAIRPVHEERSAIHSARRPRRSGRWRCSRRDRVWGRCW